MQKINNIHKRLQQSILSTQHLTQITRGRQLHQACSAGIYQSCILDCDSVPLFEHKSPRNNSVIYISVCGRFRPKSLFQPAAQTCTNILASISVVFIFLSACQQALKILCLSPKNVQIKQLFIITYKSVGSFMKKKTNSDTTFYPFTML